MIEKMFQPYRNYNFLVAVNGILMSFSKVSGLEKSTKLEPLEEGGLNGHVHYMNDGLKGERTLVLEYGMTMVNKPLSWLRAGRRLPLGVTVMAMGDSGRIPEVTYDMAGCYIKRISFGEMNAKSGELIVNNLEIAYSSIDMII